MAKKITMFAIIMLLLTTGAAISWAQDDGPTSNVNIFVVICEDQAVMNMSGTVQTGYDLYYQIYSRSQGTGDPLTTLRHVSVDGEYAFSEVVDYSGEAKIASGGIGSAYVAIAGDSNPANVLYEEYVDDLQDGCNQPINPLTGSVDTGETVASNEEGTPTITTEYPQILSPFGGIINPGFVPGAGNMPYDPNWVPPRQATPGLVMAECDDYPMAEPGIIYDSDNVTIFWSWYARTEQQVQDYIDNAVHSVTYFQVVPLPYLTVSEIEYIDGDYWVFFYSQLGHLKPGHYHLSFYTTWEAPITDGYDDYGPGTENESWEGQCTFDIFTNDEGIQVDHIKWPMYAWW